MRTESAIKINGDYVHQYCENYAREHDIALIDLNDLIGRSRSYISSACNQGLMNKGSLTALALVTGLNLDIAQKNPKPKSIKQEPTQEPLKEYTSELEEIRNSILWGNGRLSHLPDYGKRLARIELKLDFLIEKLASENELEELANRIAITRFAYMEKQE